MKFAEVVDGLRARGYVNVQVSSVYPAGLVLFKSNGNGYDVTKLQDANTDPAFGELLDELVRLHLEEELSYGKLGKVTVSRLNLSPAEREKLNGQIVTAIQDVVDAGTATQTGSYAVVAKQSKKLFGHALTAKQIEGRYKRAEK